MVNKIQNNLDNPFDNFLYNIVDTQLDLYYKLGLTPNGITTISLIFGIISSYFFYKDNYTLAALLFIIAYYFDCADGKMARKYKMTSKFGDMYDHYSDYFKFGLLFALMYLKSKEKCKKILIPTIIMAVLVMIFYECQEKIYDKYESTSVFSLNIINKSNCTKYINTLKYFGTGTFILYVTALILFWKYI
jgi:phosphatidylglycerophosphate synthase